MVVQDAVIEIVVTNVVAIHAVDVADTVLDMALALEHVVVDVDTIHVDAIHVDAIHVDAIHVDAIHVDAIRADHFAVIHVEDALMDAVVAVAVAVMVDMVYGRPFIHCPFINSHPCVSLPFKL